MLKDFDYTSDKAPSLKGAAELAEWFGFWPSFHDAEILSLVLNRQGSSFLRLHTWDTTDRVNSKGQYVRAKDVIVSFEMKEIHDVELDDFSSQNVISGLSIEAIEANGAPGRLTKLVLGPCYGLAGHIICKDLEIQFNPGKPAADE